MTEFSYYRSNEESPVVRLTPAGDLIFYAGNLEVMKFCENGDIYVQGRLAENDKAVVDGMRKLLARALGITPAEKTLLEAAVKDGLDGYGDLVRAVRAERVNPTTRDAFVELIKQRRAISAAINKARELPGGEGAHAAAIELLGVRG